MDLLIAYLPPIGKGLLGWGVAIIVGVWILSVILRSKPGEDENVDEERAQLEEFHSARSDASTREDFETLLRQVESFRDEQVDPEVADLIYFTKRSLEDIATREAANFEEEKKAQQPRIERIFELYYAGVPSHFDVLHRLLITKKGEILFDYVEPYLGDRVRYGLYAIYDLLLLDRIEELLEEGSEDSWDALNELGDELEVSGYTDIEDDDFRVIVREFFARKWDELVMRYHPEPDAESFVLDLVNLGRDAVRDIFDAAEQGDRLSLFYLRSLRELHNKFVVELSLDRTDKWLDEAIARGDESVDNEKEVHES